MGQTGDKGGRGKGLIPKERTVWPKARAIAQPRGVEQPATYKQP